MNRRPGRSRTPIRRGAAVAATAALALALSVTGALPASAAGFVVTSAADSGPGTLRQAVLDANADPGADTITFDLTDTAIALQSPITISQPLTIDGPGEGALTIGRAGTADFDQLVIDGDVDATIQELTIDGIDGGTGRAISATLVQDLTIQDVTITDQSAQTGAAVYVDTGTGDVTVTRATVERNTATESAGVFVQWLGIGGAVRVTDSVFEDNVADEGAGAGLAIWDVSEVEITGSTFTRNTATKYDGGAVDVQIAESLRVENSTFTFNEAASEGRGGAIHVYRIQESVGGPDGTIDLIDSTFTDNTASAGGGAVYIESATGEVGVRGSTFQRNSTSGGNGGALALTEFDDGITIDTTLLEDNSAAASDSKGGAVYLEETGYYTEITATTFAGNSAGTAGGASIGGLEIYDVDITNSTFDESATAIQLSGGTGSVGFYNSTVVAPGAAVVDDQYVNFYYSAVDSMGSPAGVSPDDMGMERSAFTDTPAAADYYDYGGNQLGVADLGLGELTDNGGPTPTRYPESDSVLVNAGDPAYSEPDPATDQRGVGFPRVYGPAIDIGAVETKFAPPPTADSSSWVVAPVGPLAADGVAAYTATVTAHDADDAPAQGGTVTFTIPGDVTASATSCVTAADGTCSITLTSTVAGSFGISAAVADGQVGDAATIAFTAGPASLTASTIAAAPATIEPDGTDGSVVTVTLRDQFGNPTGASGGTVLITTTLGDVSAVADNGDGTYTATLTSTTEGSALLGFSLNAVTAPATAGVTVTAADDGDGDDGNGDGDDGNGDGDGGNGDDGSSGDAGDGELGATGVDVSGAVGGGAALLLAGGALLLMRRRIRPVRTDAD